MNIDSNELKFDSELERLNKNESQNVRKTIQHFEAIELPEALSSVEKDTLRFIRHNVIKTTLMDEENAKKKPYIAYLKVAAVLAIISIQALYFFTPFDSSIKIENKIATSPLLSEARSVLANFSGLNEETPEIVLQINIDEAKQLLDHIVDARNKTNDESLYDELEPVLLAIASLEGTQTFLEVRLIQKNLDDKKLIERLKSI